MKNKNESHTSWFPGKSWWLNIPCLCCPELGNSIKSHTDCSVHLSCEGWWGWRGLVALSHCTKRKISFPESSNSRGRTQQGPGCHALTYRCPAGTCGSSTHRRGVSPRNADTGWQCGVEREGPSAAAGCTGQSKPDFWLLETLGSALTQETPDAHSQDTRPHWCRLLGRAWQQCLVTVGMA